MPAAFIAVEGVDGSGKTGAVAALGRRLAGSDHVITREPGGTPAGERLRALLLSGGEIWTSVSELLLMTAARVEHVAQVIAPALARGAVVVSDRFVGSTIAYQGAGRGVPEALIRTLHDDAAGGLQPDLTLVLDLDPGTGLARSRRRLSAAGADEGRFEALDLSFHARVRASFLDQARGAPGRHAVLDASRPAAEVEADCVAALDALLERLARHGG